MAVAALAACTKSEVQYEPSGEISFAPVAKTLTKSVAGYDYGTSDTHHTDGKDGQFDGVFPTGVNLYVFANASNDAGTAWVDPYFANALFKHNANKGTEGTQTHPTLVTAPTTGAYAGDPTRYWPNVKTLKFIGYSAACNVAATSNGTSAEVSDDFTTLTISNYTQDNAKTAEGANDLMYFHALQENGYSKSEGEIAAQMKHACSWITINVAGDGVTANNWTLNSLVVKALKHSGTVDCNATTAQWTLTGEGANEDYYNASTTFTQSYVKYEKNTNNFIVLPQTPTSLDVTYTYTSQAAVGTAPAITLTETKNVPLTFNGTESWAPGVHYIYNVLITATEILIDPLVVEWNDVIHDADNKTEGNQPIEIK